MMDRLFGRARRDRAPWRPEAYRVTETPVGADVNYSCYCGCDAGFALDRSTPDAGPEHCCCGNTILVGPDATARLPRFLDDGVAFRIETDAVDMPWGERLPVALAIPQDAGH